MSQAIQPQHAERTRALRAYGQQVAGLSRNVKLYLGGALVRTGAFSIYSLLRNLYLLSLGYDAAFIGLISTARAVTSLACSLPAGMLADRSRCAHRRRKRAMLIGGPVADRLGKVRTILYGRAFATGASLMTMCREAGGAIAPLISGLAQVRAGFTPLFWGTTLVYTLGLVALWGFLMRPARAR